MDMVQTVLMSVRHPRSCALIIAAASLALVACSDGSPTQSSADVTAATTPDLRADTNQFQQISRFGSGRAVAAAAAAGTTVIATTIGVELHHKADVDQIPTELPFPITDVLVTDDSRSLVLLSSTGDGEVWALDPVRSIASFDSVVAARFSDDGDWVDLVGRESTARLSTADGATASRAARPTPGPITSVTSFGSDGRTLIIRGDSTSRPGEIWDGTELVDAGYEPGGLSRAVRAVGDPSGDRAVFGITGGAGAVGALASVDLTTGIERWRQEIGNDAVQPVWSVGHDGRVLAVVGMQVRLYRLDGTIETSWELDGDEPVDSVIAFGDAPGFAIARTGGSVVFIDATGTQVGESAATGRRLVDSQPVGSVGGLIATDTIGHVRQWGPVGNLIGENADYVGGEVNDVAVSADGASAATAASDGSVGIIDLTASSAVAPLPSRFVHPEGNVDTVAFVTDGSSVISGVSEANGESSFDDTLSRWDLESDGRSFVVPGIPETINGCTSFRNTVRVSPDGEFFVATHHDFAVSMRNVDDGSLIHEFTGHTSIVWDLAISPDGRRLATSSEDWTLRLWNLDDLTLVSTVDAPPGGYASVAFTPDSASLLASDSSGDISMLDAQTGALITSFEGQKSPTARMAVSPDGRYLVAGADEGVVRIWEVATGQIVQDLSGHTTKVTSVEFTPDGRGLVSGSTDGTTRLWRV
jgi:WD40 repeat protein